jgi:nicotinamide mononucleotide (NMN) deamidase PncC
MSTKAIYEQKYSGEPAIHHSGDVAMAMAIARNDMVEEATLREQRAILKAIEQSNVDAQMAKELDESFAKDTALSQIGESKPEQKDSHHAGTFAFCKEPIDVCTASIEKTMELRRLEKLFGSFSDPEEAESVMKILINQLI